MKFTDVEIIPGVVIDSEDPKFLGRVKCAAPGLFDPEVMDIEILPWCYPWFMIKYQSFSKMLKGCKVWIIRNLANKGEYWYLPMFEYIDASREYIANNYGNDPELIISRNNGGTIAQYYYDDTNGFVQKIGDDLYIKVNPSQRIELKAKDTHVKIEGSKVYTGNIEETYQQAVLGETLKDLLCDLQASMVQLKEAAASSPYTQSLQPGFQKACDSLDNAQYILAKNTALN